MDWSTVLRHRFARKLMLQSIPVGSHVLDIGIGSGEYWPEGLYEVDGLDVNSSPMVRFKVKADSDEMPKVVDNVYKYITMFDALEHMESPVQALKNVNRILADDGLFLGSTPNRFDPYLRSARQVHPDHFYVFDKLNLRNLFWKCGFEVVHFWSAGLQMRPGRWFGRVDLSQLFLWKFGRFIFWLAHKQYCN